MNNLQKIALSVLLIGVLSLHAVNKMPIFFPLPHDTKSNIEGYADEGTGELIFRDWHKKNRLTECSSNSGLNEEHSQFWHVNQVDPFALPPQVQEPDLEAWVKEHWKQNQTNCLTKWVRAVDWDRNTRLHQAIITDRWVEAIIIAKTIIGLGLKDLCPDWQALLNAQNAYKETPLNTLCRKLVPLDFDAPLDRAKLFDLLVRDGKAELQFETSDQLEQFLTNPNTRYLYKRFCELSQPQRNQSK